MARAVEDAWEGPLEGLVVTRYGYRVPTTRLEVVEARASRARRGGTRGGRAHPRAGAGTDADDLVLCLISGGGSALLALPAEGLTLEDKQAVNKALLKSGATISEMNMVRKHLSAIKGGRLAAAAAPARVVALMISDVPGDDPSIIASGPTVADPIDQRATRSPSSRNTASRCRTAVRRAPAREADETPKPGDKRLAARREHHDRHAASVARSRGRDRAQGRRDAGDPRRFDRRRVARRGAGPCRHRAPMRAARRSRQRRLAC